MKRYLFVALCGVWLVASVTPAKATQYVQVTGQLTNYEGKPVSAAPSKVVGGFSGTEVSAQIDALGRYTLTLPAGVRTTLIFLANEDGTPDQFSNLRNPIRLNSGISYWETIFQSGFTENSTVNFQLPKPLKVNFTVTDAQSKTLSNARLSQSFNYVPDTYQYGGHSWNGWASAFDRIETIFSANGSFQSYFYPTQSFSVFYCQSFLPVEHPLPNTPQCLSDQVTTPKFSILKDTSYQLCLPINLGANNSTPDSCIDSVINTKVPVSEDPAVVRAREQKQVQDSVNALLALEQRQAKMQRTITCIKGKLIKKVISVQPKCPAGFKVKK